MVLALVSLLSSVSLPPTLAVTGEITLRGNITPVGGIKEKVIGAHRAGIRSILLPPRNRKDVEAANEIPQGVLDSMTFYYPSTIKDALAIAFGDKLQTAHDSVIHQSRL